MLGIVKNKNAIWRNALLLLKDDFVEVISFGYFTLDKFKIIKWKINWGCSLVYFSHHFVIVFSLGYLTTNWLYMYWLHSKEYYNDRNR